MNEFEEKDYEGARNCADSIKANGDAIMGIFDDIDGVMNSLYGTNWQSTGADSARDRYNQIRKNYEDFYSKIVTMRTHVYNVTATNEQADSNASQVVSGV